MAAPATPSWRAGGLQATGRFSSAVSGTQVSCDWPQPAHRCWCDSCAQQLWPALTDWCFVGVLWLRRFLSFSGEIRRRQTTGPMASWSRPIGHTAAALRCFGRPDGLGDRSGRRSGAEAGRPALVRRHLFAPLGESAQALFCGPFCRFLLWLFALVPLALVAADDVFVCVLKGGCGRRFGARRLETVGGHTGPKVPAGPAKRPIRPPTRCGCFFGLRGQHQRREAAPGRREAGEAGGTVEVPVRPDAGQHGIYSGPVGRHRHGGSGGWRCDARCVAVWWPFGRRRQRNWCFGVRQHSADHGRCVCASVGRCQPPEL